MRREGWVIVRGEDYETRRSRCVGEIEEVGDLGARAEKGEVGGGVYVRVDIHNWRGRHPTEDNGLLELRRRRSYVRGRIPHSYGPDIACFVIIHSFKGSNTKTEIV